jgi:hypothetical protein
MEPEISSCSRQTATEPYPKMKSVHTLTSCFFDIRLSSYVCLFSSGLFPSGISTKLLYAFS